jgi:sugar-phosphatase
VLVESLAATEAAWREWGFAHGLDGDRVAATCHGVPSVEHVAAWAPLLDASEEAAAIEAAQVELDVPAPAFDGARELLELLPGRVAVVTSATLPLAHARLGRAGLPVPEVLVTPEAVQRGKPAPDPYLEAARRLGVDPADCLVVEDAPAGVAAGIAAGAQVVAVTTTHEAAELAAADEVFGGLREVLQALGRGL